MQYEIFILENELKDVKGIERQAQIPAEIAQLQSNIPQADSLCLRGVQRRETRRIQNRQRQDIEEDSKTFETWPPSRELRRET